MSCRPLASLVLLALLGCGHSEPLEPPRFPDVGPFGPSMPRRITFSLRDDLMPRVQGDIIAFTRQGESEISQYTGVPRETCIATIALEGGTLSRTLCPDRFLPPTDTLVDSWYEPSLSPDGSRVAFVWQRAQRFNTLGFMDAFLVVTDIDRPSDTTSVRRMVQYVEDGALPRHADIATDITWIGNDTLRFLATHEQIIKVKGGGAERVTDTIMRGLALMELDLVSGQMRVLPGSDSTTTYTNAPDGSIWIVREPDSTLLLRLDPATGARVPLGRFSSGVLDLIAVDGRPVAAVTGLAAIERLDLATGVIDSWDLFGAPVLRLAAAGGRRLVAEVEQSVVLFGAPTDLWLVTLP